MRPGRARSALTKLINQQNIDVMSGPLCSGGVLGSMSITAENQIPQVVMSANPKITEPGTRHEWIWRVYETSAMRASLMAKYHASRADLIALMGT